MSKYFTVDEANRTLPLVRRIVTDIVAAHAELVELIKEYGHIDPELSRLKEKRLEMEQDMREHTDLINNYIEELEKVGAFFKGPEEGLVDFYSLLDERPVFLCWKLGEGQVEYWHELDGGYAGRQRLPEGMLGGVTVEDDEDDDNNEDDDEE
jgi:hypothetical protein